MDSLPTLPVTNLGGGVQSSVLAQAVFLDEPIPGTGRQTDGFGKECDGHSGV